MNRKDLITMKPDELAKVLMDYSKDKKGEISDLTYAASITIKVLYGRNLEKSAKYCELQNKIEEARTEMCDHFCKWPYECDEQELENKCNECLLNYVGCDDD